MSQTFRDSPELQSSSRLLGMGRPRELFVTTGQRFGRGVVINPEIQLLQGTEVVRGARLRCDCGNVYDALIKILMTGNKLSCGCLFIEGATKRIRGTRSPGPPRKLFVTAGQRFGRGVVTDPEIRIQRTDRPSTDRGARLLCDCGEKYEALLSHLNKGNIVSCGCARSDKSRENIRAIRGLPANPDYKQPPARGLTGHPLFQIWRGMLDRCENLANSRYKRYGGRGITVHEPWHDVRVFIADIEAEIGSKPARCPECGSRYSLDRIRNGQGYKPGNVRWATATIQNGNKGDD
jgi:hypothetical protein